MVPNTQEESEVKVLVAQSCPTLCDPLDCSPPGSSVHGILQARILEWVVISFSRGSFQPRDQTLISYVSCFGSWIWGCKESDMTEQLIHNHHHIYIFFYLYMLWASQMALVVKNPPTNAGDIGMRVRSLGGEDPLEKEMASHSSILAWRIP